MTIDFCELGECETLALAAALSAKLTEGTTLEECGFLGDLFSMVGANILLIASKRNVCNAQKQKPKQSNSLGEMQEE